MTGRRGFMKWVGAVALTIALDPQFGSEWGAPPPTIVVDRVGIAVSEPVEFVRMQFPLMRRVYPSTIANEILSVQPMTVPAGADFFIDYVYSTKRKPWWRRILRLG